MEQAWLLFRLLDSRLSCYENAMAVWAWFWLYGFGLCIRTPIAATTEPSIKSLNPCEGMYNKAPGTVIIA